MGDKWLGKEEIEQLLGEEMSQSAGTDAGITYSSMRFEEFTGTGAFGEDATFELLYDIPLEVRVVLGRVYKSVEEILQWAEGDVVELEKLAGEPVEVMVGDQVIAKGETVIIDDKFGVLITDVVPPRERVRTVEDKLKKPM